MTNRDTSLAYSWAKREANRALMDRSGVSAALALGDQLGVPRHPDPPKNWDSMIALAHAAGASRGGLVIDAGGSKDSALLPGLASLGLDRLLALNLDFRYPEWSGGVQYQPGDATATGLPDGCADFYACLSVIEHGVDEEALAAEARRVLRPGGTLMISTDYWAKKVDSRGQVAFGAPIKVYSDAEILRLAATLCAAGFVTTSGLDLRVGERTVSWMGLDYTFMNLVVTKAED